MMGEKISYSRNFPDKISGIGILNLALMIISLAILSLVIILEGYHIEMLMLASIIIFLMPFSIIASIKNTIDLCRQVFKENSEIVEKDQAIGMQLLTNDGYVEKKKTEILLIYGLMIPFLIHFMLFHFVGFWGDRIFLYYALDIMLVLIGLGAYRLRGIVKYFKSASEDNLEKIVKADSTYEAMHTSEWIYFRKRLIIEIIVVAALSLIILVQFYRGEIRDEIIVVPILCSTLLTIVAIDIKKSALMQLRRMKKYDDSVKSGLGLVYLQKAEDHTGPAGGFVKVLLSEFKKNFEKRQQKSKDVIDKILKK